MPATPRTRRREDHRWQTTRQRRRRRQTCRRWSCATSSAGAASALLFAPSSFAVAPGRDRLAARRQRPGQDHPAAHARRPVGAGRPGAIAWARRADARAAAALPRPRQRAEGRPDASPNRSRFLLRILGGRHATRATSTPRSSASAWRAGATRSVRTLSQGQRRRVALARLAARARAAALAARRAVRRARRRRRRAARRRCSPSTPRRGGSVVLTSHLPLPIAGAARRVELDLEPLTPDRCMSARRSLAARRARPAAGGAAPRRRAAADRLLHRRGQPVSARRRPRAADAAPDRARASSGSRAARGDAVGDAALRRRPRRRLARADAARPAQRASLIAAAKAAAHWLLDRPAAGASPRRCSACCST